MAIYGAEITSPDGKKFVIPDYNPFTFYGKTSVYGASGGWSAASTGVHASTPCMFFIHGDGLISNGEGAACYMTPVNGIWHIYGRASSIGPVTWTVYIFSNRLLKDETNSAYGVQLFDAAGNIIMSNNSRPLKLEYYSPQWTADTPWFNFIQTGKKVAVLQSVCARYDPRNNNRTYFEVAYGVNSAAYGQSILGYSYNHTDKFGPQGQVVRSYYPNILAIDCSLYD